MKYIETNSHHWMAMAAKTNKIAIAHKGDAMSDVARNAVGDDFAGTCYYHDSSVHRKFVFV